MLLTNSFDAVSLPVKLNEIAVEDLSSSRIFTAGIPAVVDENVVTVFVSRLGRSVFDSGVRRG